MVSHLIACVLLPRFEPIGCDEVHRISRFIPLLQESKEVTTVTRRGVIKEMLENGG